MSTANGMSFILLSLYRPGSIHPASLFYDELTTVLEALVLRSCPVIIGGDFNVHVELPNDPHAIRLSELFATFNIVQHVHGKTHVQGGTLDLVATFAASLVDKVLVQPPGVISDHAGVCRLPLLRRTVTMVSRRVRSWKSVDRTTVRRP